MRNVQYLETTASYLETTQSYFPIMNPLSKSRSFKTYHSCNQNEIINLNLLEETQEEIVKGMKEGAFKTTIVGMGTVGTYIAAEFLKVGAQVIGADIRPNIVEAINNQNGGSFDPEIREIFHNKVSEGKLTATTDVASAVADSKVICISVPTLLDKDGNPDLSHLKSAANTVSKGLNKHSIVMLYSTVSIGTTRNTVLPILQRNGLTIGDFCLAYTPERMMKLQKRVMIPARLEAMK